MILFFLAVVILVVGVGALVVLPMVRSKPAPINPGLSPSRELLARRDRIYEELRELEFDRRVGKITITDYRESQAQLEVEAARVLQAIDVQIRVLEEEIERDVEHYRRSRSNCPACGMPIGGTARFCAGCGAPLEVVAQR